MINSKCFKISIKKDHLMKTIDKNQEEKSLQMKIMLLKVKNNLQSNILIIEIEIKDFYGLKINNFNSIQIHF